MSAQENTEMLREALGSFNEHDLDAIMAHFAEDCVFESPRGPERWGRRFVGKAEVCRGLAARFEGIPDVHYGDDDHFACGNRGVSEMDDQRHHHRRCASRRAWMRHLDIRGGRQDRPQGQLLEDS